MIKVTKIDNKNFKIQIDDLEPNLYPAAYRAASRNNESVYIVPVSGKGKAFEYPFSEWEVNGESLVTAFEVVQALNEFVNFKNGEAPTPTTPDNLFTNTANPGYTVATGWAVNHTTVNDLWYVGKAKVKIIQLAGGVFTPLFKVSDASSFEIGKIYTLSVVLNNTNSASNLYVRAMPGVLSILKFQLKGYNYPEWTSLSIATQYAIEARYNVYSITFQVLGNITQSAMLQCGLQLAINNNQVSITRVMCIEGEDPADDWYPDVNGS